MEVLVILGLVGWIGYSLIKGNTKRGAETVRAHVFLEGLGDGASVKDANRAASLDVVNAPTEIVTRAIAHLKARYAGKQAAMISDAYGKGMKSNLPFWSRQALVRAAPSAPKASEGFEEYYAAVVREVKRLEGQPDGDLHWIELLEEEGFKRAHLRGVPASTLAKTALKVGMPTQMNVR